MSTLLPAPLLGVLNSLILGLNTIVVASSLAVPALFKLLIPLPAVRRQCDRALNGLASLWVAVNSAWISVSERRRWDVQGLEGLRVNGWYLVSSNHQSWVDILVLQRVFYGHIPFLKFFLKRELIWVPIMGMVWWALDFPFMKRGRGQGARDNDLKTTREACEKFKRIPTSVINFVEGTRFTREKHDQQHSPYQHLLKPKIGGMGIALATMGELFESMIDVTIHYSPTTPTFWDLLCGRVDGVTVRVAQRPIPPEVIGTDPIGDREYRARLGTWIDAQWREKDALLDSLASRPGATGGASVAGNP